MSVTAPSHDAAAAAPARQRTHAPRQRNWGRIAAWAVMVLLLIITLFPFYWMLRTALSTNAELVKGSQTITPPGATLLNLKQALGLASAQEIAAAGTETSADINFFVALRNSVIVCTLITIGQVIFCSMYAYAFARLKFPGRDKIFFLYLIAMMIPPVFTLIPNFVLAKNLGLLPSPAVIVGSYFLIPASTSFSVRPSF